MIIGLTGAAGSGKDTVAGILVRSSKRNEIDRAFGIEADECRLQEWQRIAFADALYREVCDAFGINIEIFRVREHKETSTLALNMAQCGDRAFVEVVRAIEWNQFDWLAPHSPRQILQWWGTDYRREQDEDYWVRPVRCRVLAAQQQDRILRQEKSWAFADVRRRNEADLAYELSGSVPGALVVVERDVEAVAKHKTEAFWATCTPDYRLDNRHDLDQTRSNLSAILDAHIAAQKRLIG